MDIVLEKSDTQLTTTVSLVNKKYMEVAQFVRDNAADASPKNEALAIDLIILLQRENLWQPSSIIGDGVDQGVNMQWSESRLFCDIDDDGISVSLVPFGADKLTQVRYYSCNNVSEAVLKLQEILFSGMRLFI